MNNSKSQIKDTAINKYKLIYIPLFIGLISILAISIISYFTSKNMLLTQMKQNGISLAKQTALQVEGNTLSLDMLNKMIEDKIRLAGKVVCMNKNDLSNDLLKKIGKDIGVDEIYWYSPEGEIIYSNIDAYLGWKAYSGHPVENFRISKKTELMEDIRKDSESDNYNKYGYLRNDDGTFVQIGIRANEIEALTGRLSYQVLVEKLVKEENVTHVFLVDNTLKTIADSNINNIGVIYDKNNEKEMQEALKGNISEKEYGEKKTASKEMTVYVPVARNGEVNRIVALTLSTENVYSSIHILFIKSSIIAIMMVIMLLWVNSKNIIKPVSQLNQWVTQIDIEKDMGYRLPLAEKNTFFGLVFSINNILDNTENYFYQLKEHKEELAASNEEISSAYEQLTASEEELRAQYDEIQTYTRELENLRQELEYIAYHDALTNLPNRRMFIKKLDEEISKNKSGAVMLLDIDNFKEINDTQGHSYGDKVLIRVAEELTNIADKKIFISRFGGDEFFILIEDEEDIANIENYAKKIRNVFTDRLIIDGQEIYTTCSVGITVYPFDSNDVNQLIMNADMAMYKVKNMEKNNYNFFKDDMIEKLQNQIELEKVIREAIKNDGLKLLYQPQVDVFTGLIVGFEALLRLKNSSIPPSQFIPIAEKNRMIIQIGRWVTKEAINQISTWKKAGFSVRPIAINFSVTQLVDSGYIEFLKNELKEAEVEAKYVDIEITESIFLEKKEETLTFINQLKLLGVKISLDDFGTGYSSLSYLTFLPIDKIKLDKSLNDKFLKIENIKVMDSLVSLAHSLNLEVIAEGIEDMEQYKRLKVAGCNYIQGYLFSKPIEIKEAEEIYYNNFLENFSH